jgi:hypothetical protein
MITYSADEVELLWRNWSDLCISCRESAGLHEGGTARCFDKNSRAVSLNQYYRTHYLEHENENSTPPSKPVVFKKTMTKKGWWV